MKTKQSTNMPSSNINIAKTVFPSITQPSAKAFFIKCKMNKHNLGKLTLTQALKLRHKYGQMFSNSIAI